MIKKKKIITFILSSNVIKILLSTPVINSISIIETLHIFKDF